MDIMNVSAVYFVRNTIDYPINPIAIRPKFFFETQRIEWEDTSRGKNVAYSSISFGDISKEDARQGEIPKVIEIVTENGLISLIFLTIRVFNQYVRSDVAIGDSLVFENDEEIQRYYLNTIF